MLIGRLAAELHCYIPEELDETWAHLRHLGRRRAQLITADRPQPGDTEGRVKIGAPPMLRTIVFIPVATPVCCGGTDSTIRFAIDEKANPIPMPITSMPTVRVSR